LSRIPAVHGVLLGIALAATGCTMVGPDFERPAVQVNPSWIEDGTSAVSSSPAEYRQWWTVFDDPILDQLIAIAYRQNLDVQTAGLRVLQARAALGVAIGDFYPQTQQAIGSLTYNRTSERAAQTPPANSSNFRFWSNQLGAQVAWEMDFWGKFRRSIEAADASFLSSVAAYDFALVTLTSDVAANYVAIRTTESRLAIAHGNVKVQTEGLDIARIRFEGGVTSERDVAQALTVLSSTQATIPQLEDALQQSKNALNVLLGVPPGTIDDMLKSSRGIPAAPPQVAAGIPADLLRRRPDIRQAELTAAQQSARVGFVKADLYPAFSLIGNFGYIASDWQNYNLSDIFMAKSRAFSVGPTFQWNVLNYGRITNDVRVQDARLQESLVLYQTAVLKAQREVEDGLSTFWRAQQRTVFLKQGVDAAQLSRDLAFLQYSEGITDFTTVLTAEQNLLSAQDNLAQAQGEIPTGLISVYRALGGGWDVSEPREFVPAETREAMAKRTDWGNVLTPVNLLDPAAPPLPGVEDVSARVRAPEW
jgi:NodT family efflux transporter outer membrane factor (OMF) lipoprotein